MWKKLIYSTKQVISVISVSAKFLARAALRYATGSRLAMGMDDASVMEDVSVWLATVGPAAFKNHVLLHFLEVLVKIFVNGIALATAMADA